MMLILFTLIVAAVAAAHFEFARLAWRRLQGAAETSIDLNYVRRDNWLAHSFLEEMRNWTAEHPTEQHDSFQLFRANRDRLLETPNAKPTSRAHNHTLYSFRDNLDAPPGSVFTREVNVNGHATLGAKCQLQALTAGGTLTLGPQSRVARWLDSTGALTLGADGTIGSRVTSATSIHAESGVTAQMLSSPLITTAGYTPAVFDPQSVPVKGALQFPLATSTEAGGLPQDSSHRLLIMEEDSLLHDGDLHFALPVEIRCRLVVRGSFSCPAGSVLRHDVKAEGDIKIGGDSLVEGNLVAGRNLALFDGACFHGLLHAAGDLLLATRVRGAARPHPVAAYAAGTLYLESNVAVEGKVAAGHRVKIMRTAGK